MLCGGVAVCQCMVCVLFAVLSATIRTQHSEQCTFHTHDMLPHQRITYNDVVFIEF